jgi:hypothetical protein
MIAEPEPALLPGAVADDLGPAGARMPGRMPRGGELARAAFAGAGPVDAGVADGWGEAG